MPVYGEVPLNVVEEPQIPTSVLVAVNNGYQIPTPDPLDAISSELDGYFHLLTTLNSMDSTEVFQSLSAISARASEIRHRLVNLDNRKTNALRTKHVDPLLDEIDRQFRFHSRIQAVRQMEWDASKGQT